MDNFGSKHLAIRAHFYSCFHLFSTDNSLKNLTLKWLYCWSLYSIYDSCLLQVISANLSTFIYLFLLESTVPFPKHLKNYVMFWTRLEWPLEVSWVGLNTHSYWDTGLQMNRPSFVWNTDKFGPVSCFCF